MFHLCHHCTTCHSLPYSVVLDNHLIPALESKNLDFILSYYLAHHRSLRKDYYSSELVSVRLPVKPSVSYIMSSNSHPLYFYSLLTVLPKYQWNVSKIHSLNVKLLILSIMLVLFGRYENFSPFPLLCPCHVVIKPT